MSGEPIIIESGACFRDVLLRNRLTAIMHRCYSKKLSVCPKHLIFQPQKAINLILGELDKVRGIAKKGGRGEVIAEIERHITVGDAGQLIVAIGEDTHLATRDYKWWEDLKSEREAADVRE